jgi:hypothetical protein
MSTKVYFFGDESGRVKIGQTGDVQDRLQKCQTGNAETLTVLGWYCVTAWELFESSVHERFAKFRIRGEWFKRTPEIDAFIAKHCTSGPCPTDFEVMRRAAVQKLRTRAESQPEAREAQEAKAGE